jgi:hypothetical protein
MRRPSIFLVLVSFLSILFIYLSVCLWLYSPCAPWPLFSFLIHAESVGLLGLGISPSQGPYLHIEQQKHRINVHRHPCLEWDSNPRSQCSRERVRSRDHCHPLFILCTTTKSYDPKVKNQGQVRWLDLEVSLIWRVGTDPSIRDATIKASFLSPVPILRHSVVFQITTLSCH